MATNALEFYYDIGLSYILNGSEHTIDATAISHVIVDSDYNQKNMPIIYLVMSLDTDIYNLVINNDVEGRFSMVCRKYKTTYAIRYDLFKGLYEYFIPTDRNSRIETSSTNTTSNSSSNSHKKITVGLISADILNNNKKSFNGIFANTNSSSLAYRAMKHMKILFEPFDHNYKIDQFVVPPVATVSEFLEYLNYYYPFYTTDYRYFIDFNVTYLLSKKGVYIDPKDGSYKTINVKITTSGISTENDKGIIVNDTLSNYTINNYVHRSKLKVNRYTQASSNQIKVIDTDGNTSEEEFNIDSMDDIKRYTYQRVANVEAINILRNNVEQASVVLEVTKQNMDTSVITPNKIYQVTNTTINSEYDGKYILLKKQDIFKETYGSFECFTTLTLGKITE